MKLRPGQVRDAITEYLATKKNDGARIADIHLAVNEAVGKSVSSSSVRSYLNLNTPTVFERVSVGHYRLRGKSRV